MDPAALRLLTVIAYFIAAILCGLCAFRWHNPARSAWVGMALLLTFLALSKQWNLLPQWVQSVREIAWLQGWYGLRRGFQMIFIAVILVFLLAWLLAVLRNSPWQLWLPITAVTILFALSIVRAVSLHMIDDLLYQEIAPRLQPNALIELSGLTIISLSALLALLWPQKPPQPSTSLPR